MSALTVIGSMCEMHRSGQRYYTIILLFLFCWNCFEYRETLVLAPDFSGYIDLEYTVPVHENRSMLAFLPVSKEAFLDRYGDTGRFQIDRFTVKSIETENEVFPLQASVKLRLRFKDVSEMEGVLPGQTRISRNNYELTIQRIFPASMAPREMGRLARNVYDITEASFTGRKMEFRVIAPWYYDILSNVGTNTQPGQFIYVLPLERTMKENRPVIWKTEVKANPLPEVVP